MAMLQHADSAFPGGAISFSQGLESLVNSGLVSGREQVADFLIAQLQQRWATLDRPILVHAADSAFDIDALATLDALIHAHTLVTEQRTGSIKMGNALLSIHSRLGSPGAALLAARIGAGSLRAHLPVIQGALWAQAGFDRSNIQIMAAHGLCTGLLSAAVRLSAIGFIDAQRIHSDAISVIEQLIAQPVTSADQINNFVPTVDIMCMHHETDDMRLFMN